MPLDLLKHTLSANLLNQVADHLGLKPRFFEWQPGQSETAAVPKYATPAVSAMAWTAGDQEQELKVTFCRKPHPAPSVSVGPGADGYEEAESALQQPTR